MTKNLAYSLKKSYSNFLRLRYIIVDNTSWFYCISFKLKI